MTRWVNKLDQLSPDNSISFTHEGYRYWCSVYYFDVPANKPRLNKSDKFKDESPILRMTVMRQARDGTEISFRAFGRNSKYHIWTTRPHFHSNQSTLKKSKYNNKDVARSIKYTSNHYYEWLKLDALQESTFSYPMRRFGETRKMETVKSDNTEHIITLARQSTGINTDVNRQKADLMDSIKKELILNRL